MKKIVLILLLVTGFASAQCFETINPGRWHALGLKTDNILFAWGDRAYGVLGNLNVGGNVNYPLPVHLGLNEWKHGYAGDLNSIGIKLDGSLYGWGYDPVGMMFPPPVGPHAGIDYPHLIDEGPWKSATVCSFMAAIKEDGTLWTWGNGNPIYSGNTPVYVPTITNSDTDWKTAIAGGNVLYALKTDGSLWRSDFNNPVFTQIGTDSWLMITTRYGVKSDGTLWNIHPTEGLTQIGSDSDWSFVSHHCSSQHAFAIKNNGTLWAWGSNGEGQLGLGYISSSIPMSEPIQVGTDTDWTQATGGLFASFGIKTDGSAWSWGFNGNGYLGLGDYEPRLSPTLLWPCNNPLSTEDIALENKVKIFPNPAEELINITIPDEVTLDYISIYDLRGNLILEKNTNFKEINVSHFSTGVYLMRLHSGNNIVHKKFIKQ